MQIAVNEKQSFIRWFLNHYTTKSREAQWILNYFRDQPTILEKVHFVEMAHMAPRGIVISTNCSVELPFRYIKNGILYANEEKAFHDIRLDREEHIYFELFFHNRHASSAWAAVVEENPYFVNPELKKYEAIADKVVEASLQNFKRHQLLNQIDAALDARDEKAFMELTELYKAGIL